jgi:hypothetical protein
MKLSAGKTDGELEMPEAAPLVFPALDHLRATEDGVKKQNAIKSKGKFISDYFDRRAQASYSEENPTSSLGRGPKSGFANRYSDPNSAANSGSIVDLLTGGVLNMKGRREERRSSRKIHKAERRGEEITPETGKKRQRLVRRMLKKVSRARFRFICAVLIVSIGCSISDDSQPPNRCRACGCDIICSQIKATILRQRAAS